MSIRNAAYMAHVTVRGKIKHSTSPKCEECTGIFQSFFTNPRKARNIFAGFSVRRLHEKVCETLRSGTVSEIVLSAEDCLSHAQLILGTPQLWVQVL